MSKSKQEKFLELYEPVHSQFEGFCFARVYGNMDFKDLMNETLLVAFEKFETLRNEKAFLSFLFTISIRILSNNYHKRKETLLSKEEDTFLLEDASARTDRSAEIHYLYEALEQLNEGQRESLILFEITGYSIKEIAELHQVSLSATKQRLKRGREKLLQIMTFESNLKRGEKI